MEIITPNGLFRPCSRSGKVVKYKHRAASGSTAHRKKTRLSFVSSSASNFLAAPARISSQEFEVACYYSFINIALNLTYQGSRLTLLNFLNISKMLPQKRHKLFWFTGSLLIFKTEQFIVQTLDEGETLTCLFFST